jgi:hypothetical protein
VAIGSGCGFGAVESANRILTTDRDVATSVEGSALTARGDHPSPDEDQRDAEDDHGEGADEADVHAGAGLGERR